MWIFLKLKGIILAGGENTEFEWFGWEMKEVFGIEQFKLENRNVSGEKSYRFAMKAYKERFSLAEERLFEIYFKNEKVRHFYSEAERKAFYDKWKRNEGV